MNTKLRVLISVFTILLLSLAPMAAIAQETSSSMRVNVTNASGGPASGATVLVTDNRTGTTRSLTTGDTGSVTAQGLRVGGPYTVAVSAPGAQSLVVTDINLRLGDTYVLPLAMGGATMEEVTVTAQQVSTMQLALGPASTFGLEDLQDFPAINRDIRDVIRFDPRIYQDQGFVGAIHCGGANPRFNSLTVDGVRMNDNFGLNSNGYPTQRQPFSYDSIQEVAVELAPFDVVYGGFTACNINAVTKSGENEFHGSAFYDYTDDDMRGDKLEGDTITLGKFDEKRYGATLGGPIVKDKLFFFLAYEKLEGAELFDRGPVGSGRAVEVAGVSQAQYDEILSIAQNLYDYDPGGLPLSLPVEDEKYTLKFDWNINDNHRAALTYNYNDGFGISESDGDADELEFSNHYYERGAELKATTAALFSDWNNRFSTEFRVSYSELDNRQLSLGGTDFGEVQIRTYNDGARATVYLGADDSRHFNKLYYETWNWKLAGSYAADNHLLTFGFERDDIDVFNIFLQHLETENRFDEGCSASNPNGCIDDFRKGEVNDLYYNNAPSLNPLDVAAQWGYVINTLYFQDEFSVGDVTFVAGLRYDWYDSSDLPNENPNFIERQGYTNADNFDGEDLFQPRFGFNWEASDRVSVRGGVGLYSGGNPNVWLSNNYSNDGITNVQVREFVLENIAGYGKDFSLFDIPLDGGGRPIYDIPQDYLDYIQTQESNGGVNAIDPNFKIPSNWKIALGATWDMDWGRFGDGYILSADLLYTIANDSAIIVNGTATETGTAPDGRPVYTESRRFNSDYILSNVKGSDAEALTLSLGLNKRYENGWDWSLGYAYTDAEDVSPMTSSVAFSNFANIAVSDFNDPGLATSNYTIPHRFTFRVAYETYLWKNYRSKFAIFGSANEGRPYSYVFDRDDGDVFGDFIDRRHLLYVPTVDDPNVVYGPGFDIQAFADFVSNSGLESYAGGIAPRNAFNSGWWTHFDFRFEQEFPGFQEDHRFSGFVVISNLCNLINDDWCTLKEVSFPRMQSVVDMKIEDGKYLFEAFSRPPGETRVANASLYEVRIGLRYEF